MTTYRVSGEAHGTSFDEDGFTTDAEAMAYASSIIDGDVDSTVEITTVRTESEAIGDGFMHTGWGSRNYSRAETAAASLTRETVFQDAPEVEIVTADNGRGFKVMKRGEATR